MNPQDKQTEVARLDLTLAEIEKQILANEQICNDQEKDLKTTLKDYWKSSGTSVVDEAQFVEALARQKALSSLIHEKAKPLIKMLQSPYFGRIDFVEDSESNSEEIEQIYIGIATLMNEETGEFLIYDWRAPVSAMFYNFERGRAFYHCPEGTIHGTIPLKRQYKIANSQLVYFFDADLTIDDAFLQEILGKSVDNKMHTIVTSIQREQNQIIRDDHHPLLFVEGPAGSGKTSIAMHRIAYLLYQDRERTTAKNVLILSPNNLFSAYIANVLPELGEENVPQLTFQEYIDQAMETVPLSFETRSAHLESLLNAEQSTEKELRASQIQFKSSPAFEQLLRSYLDWIQRNWVKDFPSIQYDGEVIFHQNEWIRYYGSSFKEMPVRVRLQKIKKIIQDRMRSLVYKLREKKEAEIVASAREVNSKVIKAKARLAAKEELNALTEQIERLTYFSPLEAYSRLFRKKEFWAENFAKKLLPPNWGALKKQTRRMISQGLLPYEDIHPFLYFQGTLQGFPVKSDIHHVVVDEAQDYTIFQYKILKELFPSSSWTILGDPAQAVHPYLQTATFIEAQNILGIKNSFHFRLTKSYRSTLPIQAFCQSLLKDEKRAEPIERSGPLPTIVSLPTISDLPHCLLHDIPEFFKEGYQSVAMICKSSAEAVRLFDSLKTKMKLHLITQEDDTFQSGLVIIPSYLAKGLEFDGVLVIDADSSHYSEEGDRGLLYTICTRALHRLNLYYTGSSSPLLDSIKPELYEKKACSQ